MSYLKIQYIGIVSRCFEIDSTQCLLLSTMTKREISIQFTESKKAAQHAAAAKALGKFYDIVHKLIMASNLKLK